MYPIKIITVDKSRQLEREASEGGLTYAEMMENAGRGTALAIQDAIEISGKQALVLVGPGNNGGDGLVAAHYLRALGAEVTCHIWKRSVEGDPHFERIRDAGLPVVWCREDSGLESLQNLVSKADLILDALLGVGVSKPIEGSLKGILAAVRHRKERWGSVRDLEIAGARRPVRSPFLLVAVDCPTGLDCDSGALDPAAAPADLTVTFAYPKRGLLRFPGAEAVGELVVADIGIPPELAGDVATELATPSLVRSYLPARPREAHKGTFGRALIVAGSVNYVGAAALAGAAATRVGAGLVTMGLPAPVQAAVACHLPEATYLLLPHDMGVISAGAVDFLAQEVGGYQSLLVGPGLTQEKETVAFVRALLGVAHLGKGTRIGFVGSSAAGDRVAISLPPLVVDADGLNALAGVEAWWEALPEGTVLTPHPGEMARLIGGALTTREIQDDREGAAARMAEKWGVVVVLKGAFTVVAEPGGHIVVMPFANPGMATAGSGDALSGAIAGLRAQGAGAFEAAVAGAYVHGLAGEFVRAELGDMGMVASDLLTRLPLALRRVRCGE